MREMGDWISGAEAADIMGVHRNTVYLSLKNPVERAERWGEEDVDWRIKPLSTRGIYEVSRARAEALAKSPRRRRVDGPPDSAVPAP